VTSFRLTLAAFLFAATGSAAAAEAPARPAWPANVERLMALDAAVHAPPDLKRQLVKHRDRLLDGVGDAVSDETGTRDRAAHLAAAAQGARLLGAGIRQHRRFEDVAYEMGGIVHELAAAIPPPPAGEAALRETSRRATFLGFSPDPFRDPRSLVSLPLPSSSAREAFDAVVTHATRLAAWAWKAAGGDASVALTLPESKGPYVVRD
jgi:hypothetical protein